MRLTYRAYLQLIAMMSNDVRLSSDIARSWLKGAGCIRLEKPIALAAYLLREDRKWTREAILDIIHQETPQQVTIPAPIPVYLIYHTAWVDRDGEAHFRPDIYKLDTPLHATPDEGHPAACG
jgi:murein L,D-transpeptidase YcbB/YkuD